MHLRTKTLILLVFTLTFACKSSEGVSTNYSSASENSEVDDMDDISLIEDYLNRGHKEKENGTLSMKSGLGNSSQTATSSESETLQKKEVECFCAKYYECLITCDTPSNSNGSLANVGDGGGTVLANGTGMEEPAKDGSQDIYGVVNIRQGLNITKTNTTKGEKSGNTTNTSEPVGNGCPHYFDVRCKKLKNSATTIPTDGSGTVTTTPATPEEGDPKVNLPVPKEWHHKGCGQRNEKGVSLTMKGSSGSESQFGEFPWTAAIAEAKIVVMKGQNVSRKALVCPGSLIHPQVVLTASHCVYDYAFSARKSNLRVRLGEWDTQTTAEPYPYQDRKVKEVVIHEQLYRKGLFNDIALVILDKEVKLAPNVDTICLPPVNTQLQDYYGQECLSSGWGKDNFGVEGRYQEIMKKVEVPLLDRKVCQDELRKTKLTSRFVLHDSFICGGSKPGPGHDTCVGDGGSALVCKGMNTQSYLQFGITSWGIGCGTETPAAYVNVLKFVPWILNNLQKRHFDTSFCTRLIL